MSKLLLCFCALGMLCACTATQTNVTPPRSTGMLAWHDLVSTNPPVSQRFYQTVFGWRAKLLESGRYWQFEDSAGTPVGGLLAYHGKEHWGQAAAWVTTLDVADLDQRLAAVRNAGGKVIQGPSKIQGGFRVATMTDSEGAVLQLRQAHRAVTGKTDSLWIWHELVAADPPSAAGWYAKVFDLSVEPSMDGKRLILKSKGKPVASVSRTPFENAGNQWVPVLAVGDMSAVLKHVKNAGGQVLLSPKSMVSGQVALIADSLDAPLFLQQQREVAK